MNWDNLKDAPEWLQIPVAFGLLLATCVAMAIAIVFAIYVTGGDATGKSPCGKAGVYHVYRLTDDAGAPTLEVVCNNGATH